MVKIRYLRTHKEIVSFCCCFTVENMNTELSGTGFFNKRIGGYQINFVDGKLKTYIRLLYTQGVFEPFATGCCGC